jgi:murein DD-endopeptidase MepM/ murein hydrolase activator NlpD
VTFAGQVAGRGVVVVQHAAGTLTSLEPVTATLPLGSSVALGTPVGAVAATEHAGCAGGCVHWGVRVDGRYVDPLWWERHGRAVRLLPLEGPV